MVVSIAVVSIAVVSIAVVSIAVVSIAVVGVAPRSMGAGPAPATRKLSVTCKAIERV